MTTDDVTERRRAGPSSHLANERRQGGPGLSAFVVTAVAALVLLAAALALEIVHQYVEWPLGAGDWEIAEIIALASSICAFGIFSLGTWRRLVRVTTERERAERAVRLANQELRERTAELRSVNAQLQGELAQHNRAEEELRESEARFRSIFESSPIAMAIGNAQGTLVRVNRAAEQMLGYTLREMESMVYTDLTHPDDVEESVRLTGELMEGKRDHFRMEKRYYRKDGCLVWGNAVASAFRDRKGEIGYVILVEDITARKRVEEQLQRAREELEGKVERQLLTRNPHGLTFRELTVLHKVAAGRSDKEIGLELGISPLTASKHLSNILGKMSVTSRTEASVRAVKEGLMD